MRTFSLTWIPRLNEGPNDSNFASYLTHFIFEFLFLSTFYSVFFFFCFFPFHRDPMLSNNIGFLRNRILWETSILRREHYLEWSKRSYVISFEIKKLTYNRTNVPRNVFFLKISTHIRTIFSIYHFYFHDVAHVSGLVVIVNDQRCFE